MTLETEIKKLQKKVSENQMSRRRFMQGAMALGVGAIAPTLYQAHTKVVIVRAGSE